MWCIWILFHACVYFRCLIFVGHIWEFSIIFLCAHVILAWFIRYMMHDLTFMRFITLIFCLFSFVFNLIFSFMSLIDCDFFRDKAILPVFSCFFLIWGCKLLAFSCVPGKLLCTMIKIRKKELLRMMNKDQKNAQLFCFVLTHDE